VRRPHPPFAVSSSSSAGVRFCDCRQAPSHHPVTRQGTKLSRKRRKRLTTYCIFSVALIPHFAPISSGQGERAVNGHSCAAGSLSGFNRAAEKHRTDAKNAPGFHTRAGVPLSGGSDSDSASGDKSDTSASSYGVADWSGAEDMEFSSHRSSPRLASLRVAILSALGTSWVAPAFSKESMMSCVKRRTRARGTVAITLPTPKDPTGDEHLR